MSKRPEYVFKVCLLGQGGVGKTCVARRLCFNKYESDTKLTIGIDFYTYELSVIINNREEHVSITVWDFGGQEQFKTLFPYYINGVHGVFMVFSLVNMQSLIRLDWWYERLFKYVDNIIPRVVLGTKEDLIQTDSGHIKINDLFIDQFLDKHKEKDFFRTSSKENYNIHESFKVLVGKIMDHLKIKYDRIP
ncbi:MAG: Rab family GTPase [Promethearchaeota archaeon]